MSLSENLQNILDETLQSFLAMDLSSNLLEQLNRISPNLIHSTYTSERTIPIHIPENTTQQTVPSDNEDTGSLPDLIPMEEPTSERETRDPIDDTTRRVRLWSNILLDYHNQINTYQENMRAVFNITEHMLPPSETRTRTTYSANNNNNNNTPITDSNSTSTSNLSNRLWQSLLQSPSYVLEFDANSLLNRNTNTNTNARQTPSHNRPTPLQIQTATSLFSYNPQENPLPITICPITLEEFQEDEILMRIRGCGHIFKAVELHRWFERNHKCPSCRYDITTAAFSLPTSTSATSATTFTS